MKIQNRTEYGVRALVVLASRGEGELLSVARIAEKEGIPVAFLEQIMARMRRAGLIDSVRGANGGVKLARRADEITLADVIRVLEGSLSPIGCAEPELSEDELAIFCERADQCQTRKVWVRMTESITDALSTLTLADVVEDDLT